MAEIRNPNQPGGGGQDSHTLLIFSVVFFLIFLGVQYFLPKNKTQQATPVETVSPPASTTTPLPGNPSFTTPPGAQGTTTAPAVIAASESTTVV